MIHLFDRFYNHYRSLEVEYSFTREIGKLNTLEFDTDLEINKSDYVVIYDDGKYFEFVIIDIDYSRADSYVFSYFCQDSFYEVNGYVIKETRPTQNAIQHINQIFSGTNWEIIDKGSYKTNPVKINYYRITVLEAFRKIIETYDLEWETNFIVSDGKIVKRQLVIGRIGITANSRLEFEKNIKQFQRKTLSDPIYTALIGLGKGEEKFDEEGKSTGGYTRRITFADVNKGIWYVENNEARKKYGIGKKGQKEHFFGFVVFADETDKHKLLQRTKNELKKLSQPRAEYTIDVSNLFIDVKLGDKVAAIDEVIGFRDYLKVIKVQKTLYETVLTFGVLTKALTAVSKKQGEELAERITEEVESKIQYEVSRISKDFVNEEAYTYDLKVNNEFGYPAGIYSFNKPINENPTKVVYIGAGKVLIATSKTTDGNWDWKTAIDGTGIYGEQIATGSITANKLSADVGQSLDLSSNESVEIKVAGEVKSYVNKNKALLKGDKGDTGEKGEAGQDAEIDYKYLMENSLLIQSDTEPNDASKLWLDTSTTPTQLKIHNGTNWISLDYELKKQMTEFIALQNEYNMNFITNLEFGDFKNNINQNFNTIEKYIRFVDGKIILGQKENPFTLQISKDRISFFEGENNELAYFSNQNLYVENLEILKKLTVASAEIRMITDNVAGIGVIGR